MQKEIDSGNVRVTKEVKKKLISLKIHPRETYAQVIVRAIQEMEK